MPRNLGRLKFRAPKPTRALDLSRLHPGNQRALEREVTAHVHRLSKPPASLSLSVVTDPKWKRQPADRSTPLRYKPHTLRDLVDPAGNKKHGEIIYVFRNTKTNQVIYSLSELLDHYHLDQLPFMGKHSKPPVLRPDEWIPHLVARFPSPEQGHAAFRALREYRKLHELNWDVTNPEFRKLTRPARVKKIMDQVANTSADLAAVLSAHEKRAVSMAANLRVRERKAVEFMDKKWAEIDALAAASLAKDKRDGDNTTWLENQIKNLTAQLSMKHNKNEADQKRLTKAKRSHESRLRRIVFAQRKAGQFKAMQEDLAKKAALANAAGAEEKLQKLQGDVAALEQELAQPSTTRTDEDIDLDLATLRAYKRDLSALRTSFVAKRSHDACDHYIARSILPLELKKPLPDPFTMDVEIKWADIRDAEFAAGNWPDAVIQDVLPVREIKERVAFLNQEEYALAVEEEVKGMIDGLEREAVRWTEEVGQRQWEESEAAEPAEGKGILGFLKRNPFRRAEA